MGKSKIIYDKDIIIVKTKNLDPSECDSVARQLRISFDDNKKIILIPNDLFEIDFK